MQNPLKGLKMVSVKVGSTLHVFMPEVREEAEVKIRKAVLAGEMAEWSDRREWVDDVVLFDSSKEGSAQFQWDASGDRVAHDRYFVTQDKQSLEITRTKLRRIYKTL